MPTSQPSVARMIVLEFNELQPELLQGLMDCGVLPNFRRLYQRSTVFTTDAQESTDNLEPWIQWPTVHTGLSYAEHGVFHLGDGARLQRPGVARLLSDAGIPVGVFGSMNMNYRALNGYSLPDPWAGGRAEPGWLDGFAQVVAGLVQESSRESLGERRTLLEFGAFMLRHGLSLGTVRRIIGQLLAELRDPGIKWRRAMLLDALQYDLFRYLNKRFDVRFATLFCNSTAHFQHYYWRNMQPELFEVAPEADAHPSLGSAIRDGYRSMDRLVGRVLKDYPDATVVLCSALSQRPWDTTKCTFRPRSFDRLLTMAGLDPDRVEVRPVMAEQFHLDFANAEAAEQGLRRLEALQVDGESVLRLQRHGASLFGGCRYSDGRAVGRPVGEGGVSFDELFHRVHAMRSGRHDPAGVFWVGNGRHMVVPGRVPLRAVAPTLLAQFGLPAPDWMKVPPLRLEPEPDELAPAKVA